MCRFVAAPCKRRSSERPSWSWMANRSRPRGLNRTPGLLRQGRGTLWNATSGSNTPAVGGKKGKPNTRTDTINASNQFKREEKLSRPPRPPRPPPPPSGGGGGGSAAPPLPTQPPYPSGRRRRPGTAAAAAAADGGSGSPRPSSPPLLLPPLGRSCPSGGSPSGGSGCWAVDHAGAGGRGGPLAYTPVRGPAGGRSVECAGAQYGAAGRAPSGDAPPGRLPPLPPIPLAGVRSG